MEAWQPFTPRGVARFSAASFGRLSLVLLIFGLVAGLCTSTFFQMAWVPAIRETISKLPEEGHIRHGRLAWSGESSTILCNTPWLGVTVDVHQQQAHRLPCDLQLEFSATSVRFLSLAGYLDAPYPSGWIILFNEPELMAWWDAWAPFLTAGIVVATLAALLASWTLLALLYTIPAGAICRFVDHRLPFSQVLRICLAAQMPGSLLMSFTLLLYSVRAIELVEFLFLAAAHFVVSWIYVGLAVFFIPASTSSGPQRSNPFTNR